MNTPKLIVGNWKMNTSVPEASLLIGRLRKELHNVSEVEIVLLPPATHLYPLTQELKKLSGPPRFVLGAQNISEHSHGSYTGEIAADMVTPYAQYVLVGHSERRRFFGETDKVDAQKMHQVITNGRRPILCVGEDQDARESGKTKQVLLDQLNTGLSQLTPEDLKYTVIAYEPVWAIGNGNFAKPALVEEAAELIKSNLLSTFGKLAGSNTRVIYGGSVNPENCKAYLDLKNIDGLLVGGASLNYKQFSAIVQAAA